jgi:hypothetical protein
MMTAQCRCRRFDDTDEIPASDVYGLSGIAPQPRELRAEAEPSGGFTSSGEYDSNVNVIYVDLELYGISPCNQ